jgi:hypothetical protein
MKEKSINKADRASLDAYLEETHPQHAVPPVPSVPTENTSPSKRISTKMRRGTLEAYKQTFLVPAKLTDRRAVYLSRETQEHADFVVRRLGDRGANLSNFVERVMRTHLEDYAAEIEEWRKL